MRTALTSFAVAVIWAGSALPQDTETKVKMKNIPAPVQDAVKAQSQGATLVGLAREVEGGVTRYEAEMKVGNRTRDVTFDSNGKVVIVEEETTLGSIPAAARGAIEKALGKHKLQLVEVVKENGATFYEAHFRSGLRSKEVKVDADGKLVGKS